MFIFVLYLFACAFKLIISHQARQPTGYGSTGTGAVVPDNYMGYSDDPTWEDLGTNEHSATKHALAIFVAQVV